MTPHPHTAYGGFTVAAVAYGDEGDAAAAALWQAVRAVQADGRRVAGLLNPLDAQGRHLNGEVASVADGRRFPIFQNLGSGASGCKLDAGALADAGAVIREAVERGADLVVINKFGHAETENRGLLAELLAAAAAGIPVLTGVHSKYLPQWRHFSDGLGTELPPDGHTVAAWARQAAARGRA